MNRIRVSLACFFVASLLMVLVLLWLPGTRATAEAISPEAHATARLAASQAYTYTTAVTVNSASDPDTSAAYRCSTHSPCTLRRAIVEANYLGSGDRPILIKFNIPITDAGHDISLDTWKIELAGGLPAVKDGRIIIDGDTQGEIGGRTDGPKIVIKLHLGDALQLGSSTSHRTSGEDSPCPYCLIELFLDDGDVYTEALQSLAVVTATATGEFAVNLSAPFTSGQRIRTASTVRDFGVIENFEAGTTSRLSEAQVPPQAVDVIEPGGGSIVYTNTQGLVTRIEVPPGALGGTTSFTYTTVTTPAHSYGALLFAGRAFDLDASATLVGGITITLSYRDEDLATAGIDDESSLRLYYWTGAGWDDAANICTPASEYSRDEPQNTVSVAICHLSSFGLFSDETAVTGVDTDGPDAGIVGVTYAFTATVSPPTATLPITYAWQATGQTPVMHIVNGLSDTVTFTWSTEGLSVITVTAENAGGMVTDAHTITISAPPTCPHPLSDVSISGPTEGYTDTPYAFTAVITPADATLPITYTWSPAPTSGPATDTHVITISATTMTTQSVYFDDFDDPYSGWPDDEGLIYDDKYWRRGYQTAGSEYRISIDQGGSQVWFYQPDALAPYAPPSDKYSVETRVRFAEGQYWANMGLIFGANETNTDIYALCLSQGSDPDRLGWFLMRNADYHFPQGGCSSPTSKIDGTDTVGTNRNDWNQLQVDVDGDIVTVYIGGFYKGQWTMSGLSATTRAGVIGGPYEITPVDIRFDYFKVTSEAAALTSPGSIVIDGPTEGVINDAYTFTATVSPPTVTLPITYAWQATGQTPVTHIAYNRSNTANFNWSTHGIQTVTVTASNTGGTVSATHTITITGTPDAYEPDDTCDEASTIPVSGTVQVHSFHDEGDEDWVSFQATAGVTHVVEIRVPPTSMADVALEVYDSCGPGGSFADSDPTFSPDIRLSFRPPADGTYYLHLTNSPTTTCGSDVVYHLSVRTLEDNQPSGAVILVAGRLKTEDELQGNIHNVTNVIYDFALAHGCTAEQIRYLATETMTGVIDLPTKANLEYAITEWAVDKVGPDQPLTLYLMDHGAYDLLYLDKPNEEWITPEDLDSWLDELEDQKPGVAVNVVVEACYSGSFIDWDKTVSSPGRVVIASTSNSAVAYASQEGATFSDTFLEGLKQGTSLFSAFEEGSWAARQGHPDQQPWLDDDGDGVPNEPEDGEVAALRSLACETLALEENWPPYVVEVAVGELSDGQGEIWAQVQDDKQVLEVSVVIYPPSYRAPVSGEEMIEEPAPVALEEHPTEEGWYTSVYTGFNEIGEYRLVVYATDNEFVRSRLKEATVRTGWPVYLPLVMRQ